MSSCYDAAVYYINTFGWYLVPVPAGTKGPRTPGWNTIEKSIHDVDGAIHWKENRHDNVGVLLAPSKLVVVDIDNIEETKIIFSSLGIDYNTIFDGCPRLHGKEDHDKAMFRAPDGIDLKAYKLFWPNKDDIKNTHAVFELRAGMVQDVLPPSIHPDLHKPYEWDVEPTDKIPELPKQLLSLWQEWRKFVPELHAICPWGEKKPISKEEPKKSKTKLSAEDNLIEKYNQTIRIESILERHGYKRVTPTRYLSPYSSTGLAGVVVYPSENRIFSHHGSDPFDTSKTHDAFDLFCYFEHDGNISPALIDAARILGIKTNAEKMQEHGAEVSKNLMKAPEPKTEESIAGEIEAAKNRCLLPDFPELQPGIFNEYVELGKRVSYSLHEYHFAALLAIASMALGRKVVAKVGMVNIYPNVYVMVVGQTTISGKSVACNMAMDNFGEAIAVEEEIAKYQSTHIIRGTISEAALIQTLSEIYNLCWFFDDCGGFFEDLTTWNAHILGTLCSIYDGSAVERTLSKRSKNGEQSRWVCPQPYMSLLFNTTTKDIEQVASSKLFSSGFFPRLMWFYGQGGTPKKNKDITDEDIEILGNIRLQLKEIRDAMASLKNESIVFGVCDIIEEWKIKATMDRLNKEDEAYRTAISRGFIHAYKIATILSVLDGSFRKQLLGSLAFPVVTKIPDKHAHMAIRIVDQYLIPRMMYVCEMCNSVDAKNHQIMVMKALNSLGGVGDRTKLLRLTHLGKKDMDAALQTMTESGEVVCHCVTNDNAKKPTMVIIKQ